MLFSFSKFLIVMHYLLLFRSSGIQEDSESEFTVPESTSSAGPVGAGSRPSGPSAILSAPSSDRKALR